MPKTEQSGIAYQNKDIVSKIFGQRMKNRSLETYGIHIPKIVDVMVTNLPGIEVNELRIDNIFCLEDGSYAIIDYESEYDFKNKLKYLGYVLRTLRGLVQNKISLKKIRLHIIVIYTADVKYGNTTSVMDVGGVRVNTSEAFLSEIDGDEEYRKIALKLRDGEKLMEADIMKLIILPLTYEGKERQQQAAREAVQLAKAIADKETQGFVLAGILSFTDKIIDKKLAGEIRRELSMTKVGQIIADEIEEKVRQTREEVTKKVTKDVTEQVTKNVTEQITQKEQEKSFQTIISVCQDVGLSVADAMEKLIASYGLTENIAGEKVQKYWKTVK